MPGHFFTSKNCLALKYPDHFLGRVYISQSFLALSAETEGAASLGAAPSQYNKQGFYTSVSKNAIYMGIVSSRSFLPML